MGDETTAKTYTLGDVDAALVRAREQVNLTEAGLVKIGPNLATLEERVARVIRQEAKLAIYREPRSKGLPEGIVLPDDQLRAAEIMGKNYWGWDEWRRKYRGSVKPDLIPSIPPFPWTPAVLEGECPFNPGRPVKETHFAFLGLSKVRGKPLTIMQWRAIHPTSGQPRFYSPDHDCWYHRDPFATEVALALEWHLVLLDIVPGSVSKRWGKQLELLPENYRVPTAIVEVTKDLLVYRRKNRFVNQRVYARCDSVTSHGYRVGVGRCGPVGLSVGGWFDGPLVSVGVGASRNPNT